MPPPPIQLFLTGIALQPTLRQRQEYILRILQSKKIEFTSYDLASDEDAKKLWRRKAPADKQQLPGLLIGGVCPGTFQDFEEAVEFGELDQFLRRNDEWKPFEDEKTLLAAKPIGIAGAYTPSQMNPHHVSPHPTPSKPKVTVKQGEKDAGEQLDDAALRGVTVTDDDLLALVEELGLEGDAANDLVKGLSNDAPKSATPSKVAEGAKGKPKDTPKETKVAAETETVKTAETKAEEVKVKADAKDVKVDEDKPVETKVEEVKVEAAKVDEVKVEEVKVEEAKVEEAVEEDKVKEVQPEGVKPEDVDSDAVKSDQTKQEDSTPEEAKGEEPIVVTAEPVSTDEGSTKAANAVDTPEAKAETSSPAEQSTSTDSSEAKKVA